jgi:tRNA (mo5U34)-methyltransferase
MLGIHHLRPGDHVVDIEELRAEIAEIGWWHTIDLGNGIVTPGIDASPANLKWLDLPENLQGMTVLDIGAWDGFFSFEAERRGASRVLATDSFVWEGKGRGSKAGFELARRALHSTVEDMNVDVLDLSPETVGTFDLVLFLGVLYHMRHPLLALEKVYSVTRDLVIVETHVDLLGCEWPAMRFYPTTGLAGDPTNWWGPNPAAVVTMLETVGFRTIETVRLLEGNDQQGRFVAHAWR